MPKVKETCWKDLDTGVCSFMRKMVLVGEMGKNRFQIEGMVWWEVTRLLVVLEWIFFDTLTCAPASKCFHSYNHMSG